MHRKVAVVIVLLLLSTKLFSQSGNASLTGFVQDTSKAFVSGVHVLAINTDTNQQFEATSNRDGSYTISSLPVGPYRLQIEKIGFRTLLKEGLFLHTQDTLQINFELPVGSMAETVTVNSDTNNINTVDAAVETVIDHQFVDNIPMNGRSFQTLVLLSPGAVTNTPQVAAGGNDSGEYVVNGMRSDSNNFMVDGASASNQAGIQSAAGSTGMLPSATALGTTQAMLQIDAMEEFRISTSTYSAEYGRQPGGQVTFRSRSGTNEFHGNLYDYLRNSAFDSNNWFNTYSKTPTPTPAERQNDFGGTLGGPLSIPYLYSGKDRAFFFFAYEGLRLTQPQAASIYYVPSNGTFNTSTAYADPRYKNLRLYAPPALQPLMNSFPLPNCSVAQDAQCIDYGEGGSAYISSPFSNGALDSINVRLDYQLLPTMRIFARYNDTTSSTHSLSTGGPAVSQLNDRSRVYLLGSDNTFGGRIANELRLQYSSSLYISGSTPVQIGGASHTVSLQGDEGLPGSVGESVVHLELPNTTSIYQIHLGSQQYQPNGTDSFTWTHGRHVFKFGGDYRQTTAYYNDGALARSPYVAYGFDTAAEILENSAAYTTENEPRVDPTYKNLGLFAQDEWHVLPRLSLSLGLRWDLNPPPSVSGAQAYTYTGDINNPSTLVLSTQPGGKLYSTKYTNFAPRFGMAFTVRNQPGHELVLRTGAGLFYDLIALNGMFGNGTGIGTSATNTGHTGYPVPASIILEPIKTTPTGPYSLDFYPANNLISPSALQWNFSLEQAFGDKQTVTMGYVGSMGRNLLRYQAFSFTKLNPNFGTAEMYVNGPGSNYNSLQLKYQRQMSHGLQVLGSYTWAHSIDSVSTEDYNVNQPFQRGNSNFDVRHNFTAALVYNVPSDYSSWLKRAILGHWNTDLWFVSRTAFPYEVLGPAVTDPSTGETHYEELNYNGKVPYVYKAGIPGGRQVDPTIFTVTNSSDGVGNAPRNFLRGFGEIQANFALQREFPLYERLHLQFRGEAFNIANHPNFGTISTTCGATAAGATCNNTIMGQPTATLGASLGGLSALYQQGGPRSLQLAMKIIF